MQHKRYGYGLAAVAVSALLVTACSGTDTDTSASSAASSEATSVATTGSTGATTGDAAHNGADVMFAQGMIPHHQQAIEMSDMILAKQGIDPAVVSLANDIKDAQGPEIEQMQGWLQEWGMASAPMPGPAGMPGHDMPGHEMPGGGMGMMSEADMVALSNAQGADAGRLFLTQMIEHHEGAITMAQQEIDNGVFPAAVALARAIVSAQQAEITTMQDLLQE